MKLRQSFWLILTVLCLATATDEKEKELIESQLLGILGLKARPKVDKSQIVIPPAMLEMYEKQMGLPLDTTAIPKPGLHTSTANTVRSFTHVESPIDKKFTGPHRFRLKFDISLPEKEHIKAAEIKITTETVQEMSKENKLRIIVKDIIKPGRKGKHDPITRVIDSKIINLSKETSISLDVLPAVERWLEDPANNHGLLIKVIPMENNRIDGEANATLTQLVRVRRSLGENEHQWSKKQPLLFTYSDDGSSVPRKGHQLAQMRRRRSRPRKKDPCKRHPMYVDFNDVGWSDWIVAPPGYEAFYCHGECNFPLAEHLNTTNHAIVQTLMNSASPSKVPKACCVPTQLNPISMLYVDDARKVVLKNYKDMVVMGCGCR